LSGSTWISDTVTDDNLLDFSPQVAFDAEGDAVAVWERINTVHISPTLNITFVRSLEIASAQWLSDTQSWTNVVTLTQASQGLMDTVPQLVRGQADGTLLSTWRTSDGYELVGTITHPLTITYALWDGDNWSTPAAALSGLTGTIDVNVAIYSATQAALVLAQDTDGDEISQSDNELFYATWDGATWSGLTQLTNDTITDTAPVLDYDEQGTITLVWLRGDDLVMHTGWPTAPITYSANVAPSSNFTVVRSDSTSGAFLDYQLQRDPDGNLILLWQEIGTEGVDVAYTVYDAANDSWGADNALTSDGLLEEAMAPAFDEQGDLYMVYNKVTMDWVTTTQVVAISPTLTVTVTEYMPEPVQSDIFQLVHTLGRDLGIDDADIALSDPNPAPGGHVTISTTVHNLGDLAITGTQVIFYDGDPDAGGIQIGTPQAMISPFRAATTETVSIEWDVPAGANSHLIYVVVDATDAITETNEANNQAVLGVVLPDLTVAWAYSLHTTDTLTLTATISNVGTLAATGPFSVDFRAGDAVTGTLLGTASVGGDLAAGDGISVNLTLNDPVALAGIGDRFWIITDAGEMVTEANETNNTHYAALNVLPDLTLATTDIQFGDAVTVTVHNVGVLTATDTMLAVWQGGLNGPTVYSSTLGDLGPGASETTNFTTAIKGDGLWIKIDPNNTVVESDESNNLAVRVSCPQPLISVDIDGSTKGTTNTLYAFTATIVPTDATGPISYTWTPTPNPGSLLLPDRSTVTYTWDALGTYTITLTAEGCSGRRTTIHTIAIQPPTYDIYLPLVLRNFETAPIPDRYVERYGSDTGDCSTPETSCGSIQYAVDQASPGDLIGIAGYADAYTPENPDGMVTRTYWYVESHASPPGYNGPAEISQVVYVDESVTLYGGYNADFDDWDPDTYKTVLRPGLSGLDARVVFIDPNAAATLEWLYIIEGNAYGQGGLYNPPYEHAGNGIFAWGDFSGTAVGVTIRNCMIVNNSGAVSSGGGVNIKNRNNSTIANNTVQGNRAYRGGGISISESDNVIVSDNVVAENTAYGQQAGGIYLVSTDGARLISNQVYSNTASESGGGIEARFSENVYLIGNTVHDNVASQYKYGVGGGVDLFGILEGYTVQNNIIYNNIATIYTGQGDYDTGIGGGLYLNDTENGIVVGNIITGNVASQNFRGTGGGLSIYSSDNVRLERNLIQGNVATPNSDSGPLSTGGGVRISLGSPNVTLSNNIIVGNQAPAGGGGVIVIGNSNSPVESTFLHNTIADNKMSSSSVWQITAPDGYELLPGAASAPPTGPQFAELRMLAESTVPAQRHLDAVMLAGAQGILVAPYSTFNGVNNLISGHTLGISVTNASLSTVTMDHTLWYNNTTDYSSGVTHTNDRSGDPLFVDPAAWDFHIGSGSVAIDQGTSAGVTSDWDGDTRPQGSGYDIGADEYASTSAYSVNAQRLARDRRRYTILSTIKSHIP
ncbi:MAG: hypothetical protein GY832_15930, partial [Chloroflexi bacterium]|nr:hypothetical protein [Chloroflexota bacterium]